MLFRRSAMVELARCESLQEARRLARGLREAGLRAVIDDAELVAGVEDGRARVLVSRGADAAVARAVLDEHQAAAAGTLLVSEPGGAIPCDGCGYDLRIWRDATAPGTCPECGHPFRPPPRLVECPQCEAWFFEDRDVCPSCRELVGLCPACGQRLPRPGRGRCPVCGAAVAPLDEPAYGPRYLRLVALAAATPYTVDTFTFVDQVLAEQPPRRTEQSARGERGPLDAAALCRALRQRALRDYGVRAVEVLRGWGLTSSEDFGAVVDAMIAGGLIDAAPLDCRRAFAGQFQVDWRMEWLDAPRAWWKFWQRW